MTVNKILHYVLLVLLFVSGLGPTVSKLAGIVPSNILNGISAAVAVSSAIVLYLSQSPLFAPLLPVKTPDAVIGAEKVRAVKIAGPVITAFALCLALALQGCSWFQSPTGTTVVQDVGAIAACILTHIETDVDPTAESIAAECAPAAVTDVVTILTALDQPTDAGTSPASAKAHGILAHRGAK